MRTRALIIVFAVLAIAAFAALGAAIVNSSGGTKSPAKRATVSAVATSSVTVTSGSKQKNGARSCQARPAGSTLPSSSTAAAVERKVTPVACEQPPRSQLNLPGLNNVASNAAVQGG
jgi:hypothetical protein